MVTTVFYKSEIKAKLNLLVAYLLQQNIMIKKLNISWNGFGVEGARELGKAIMENTTLEELDISNNRITTEGAVLFGKGLVSSESLVTLRVSRTPAVQ